MMSDTILTLVTWDQAEAELRRIRHEVYIVEQAIPEELEWDGLDADCIHVLVRAADGTPVGTGRMTADGHIGRMAVIKPWRGRGIGSTILRRLLQQAREQGLKRVKLNAQISVQPFYEQQGFHALGEEFLDADIPHVRMEREL
jgi:predicted GNAT family N-acyltransferase